MPSSYSSVDRAQRGCDRWRAILMFLSLGTAANTAVASDWLQFAYDVDQSANNTSETTITSANVHSLVPIYTQALGTTSAPVYLSNVATSNGNVDLLFMTARNGTMLAVDANNGVTVWSQPTTQISYAVDSAPVIDPGRQFVYGYGADGKVHKYAVADGTEVLSGDWPAVSSLKPGVEHGSGALEIARSTSGSLYLYAVTTGFYGDGGDYQGHVTAINLSTGTWTVFNANCSNIPGHFIADGTAGINDCATPRSGIWGRSGAVYDRRTSKLYVATGNGNFNVVLGGYNWGDSLLALKADGSINQIGTPLDSYTPSNYSTLEASDSDFGSGSVVLLPTPAASAVAHLGAIMGKDAQLRLLNMDNLSGQGSAGGIGGEIQKLDTLGVNTDIPTPHPAVWVNARGDGSTWLFVATPSNISGVQLVINGAGQPSLAVRWTSGGFSGTSPIVANNVLYYGGCGGICALAPTTGQILWSSPLSIGCCMGGWANPIVVNGRLFVTGGSFTIFALDAIFANGFE
jgi:hypothetical protein